MMGGETGLRLRLLGLAVVTGLFSQFCVNFGDCAAPTARLATAAMETATVVGG